MTYAPIAIFCYNRPDHLKRMVESLMLCTELSNSEIVIFQDGCNTEETNEITAHEQVSEYIADVAIGKNKRIYKSDSHLGRATSVKNGVSKVLLQFEKVIVLEDGLEVSSGFLKYMNEALQLYESEDKVMHVSGYMFPFQMSENTFFMNYTSCWGWGTWRRAWQHLEWDCLFLHKELIKRNKWDHFTLNNTNGNDEQLISNILGRIDTWAVRWHATIEIYDGYCLHPAKSLVQNTGFDGSGTNCNNDTKRYYHTELATNVKVQKVPIKENSLALARLQKFYSAKDSALLSNIRSNKFLNYVMDMSLRKLLRNVRSRIKSDYDLDKLNALPRFTDFSIRARNFEITGCDNASFVSMWNEIFIKEIYKFRPKRNNPVIVDVGANIGVSALYFSRQYETAQIYAYEADPRTFNILERNIHQNNIKNVMCYNLALWKENGEIQFRDMGSDAGYIDNSNHILHTSSVKTISFKTLISGIEKKIDLLKMDIEGAEIEAILSYPEGLKNIDNVFIEYHSFKQRKQNLNELLNILTKSGFRYQIFNVYDKMPKSPFLNKVQYGEMDLQVNIFAYRN